MNENKKVESKLMKRMKRTQNKMKEFVNQTFNYQSEQFGF